MAYLAKSWVDAWDGQMLVKRWGGVKGSRNFPPNTAKDLAFGLFSLNLAAPTRPTVSKRWL